MAWAAARTLWFAVALARVLRHDNLQGFALDGTGGLRVATRLTFDGRAVRLPGGYDHVGAPAYAPGGWLLLPVEDAARTAPLLLTFRPDGALDSTCGLRQQRHAPWVAARGASFFSSEFGGVRAVCEYAAPACRPRGCRPLGATLDGMQGGAFDPRSGALLLAAGRGPRGAGVYAFDPESGALETHLPVCVGPFCLGEIEGLAVNETHLVVGGSYGLWWLALVWTREP
jgi:hypothetical protein